LKKILFVCLGNICRSPTAEGVMAHLVNAAGFQNNIKVDSAGTSNFHVGEEADPRSKHHALKRGIELTSIARQFNPRKDFKEFDYILAMDQKNLKDLKNLDPGNKFIGKVHLVTQFCKLKQYNEVPDPYFTGERGFELVLDILEDACQGLLEKLKNEWPK
jgi:protein-tyrosine phosphatase